MITTIEGSEKPQDLPKTNPPTIQTLPSEIRQIIYRYCLDLDTCTELSFSTYDQRHQCSDCAPITEVYHYRTRLRYNALGASNHIREGFGLTKVSPSREEILEYLAKEQSLVAHMPFEYGWGICDYTRLSKTLPDSYRVNLKQIVVSGRVPLFLSKWVTQLDHNIPALESLTLPLTDLSSRILISRLSHAEQPLARRMIECEKQRAKVKNQLFRRIPGSVGIVDETLPSRPARIWEL